MAQEKFIRLYERRVHAFLGRSLLNHADVDDLSQEVFLRALGALPRFEPDRARLSTWIFQIAVRLMQDRTRRARRWLPLGEERAAPVQDPEAHAATREALTEVERILSLVPTEQRMALCLFELHDLSHAEIAEVLGTTVATTKTRIWRARRALEKALSRSQKSPPQKSRPQQKEER